jgi:hypothetical protein
LSQAAGTAGAHHLPPTPSSVRWGYFDRGLEPVITIASGELVWFEALTHHAGDVPDYPKDGERVEAPGRWVMVEEARGGDIAQFWASHKLGADREYCQIEKLCNLDALPEPHGFQVIALPVSIARWSAAWARVVALVSHNRSTSTPGSLAHSIHN